MARRWLRQFMVAVLSVNGCALVDPSQNPMIEERLSMMKMWNLYRHCASTTSVDELVADAARLTETVDTLTARTPSSGLLPAAIERMLLRQPNRLAVDPRAMAAACNLSAGLALNARGDHDEAADIFRSILLTYQEPQYAYYATRAHSELTRQIQPTSVSGPHTARADDHRRGVPPFIR